LEFGQIAGAQIAMNSKSLIMIGLVVGSTLGGFIPSLWGDGGLSMASVLTGAIGGFLGIWAGYKISRG
jgi:outer membrane lipoprotein SlyB